MFVKAHRVLFNEEDPMHHTTHQHGTNDHDHAPETQGRLIRWSRQYDVLVKLLLLGQERRLREATLRQAALPKGGAVLDVGCGTGTLTLLAKDRVGTSGHVYGIDGSPEMITVANQKAATEKQEINFQVGLVEALPFDNCSFDVVLSSLMFHHLPDDLKARGLAEIYRVLKPGGRLIIVDMKRPTTTLQRVAMAMMAHHGLSSGIYEFRPLLQDAGYTAVEAGSLLWGFIGFIQGQRAP
jgi:ubiquinone/menaquinone biosynthesis C-methylase UbiE